MTDDQAMSSPGSIWPRLGQNAAQAGKSSAKSRHQDQTMPPRQLKGSQVSVNQPRPKVALKQLSLRIDDGTHSRISQAAQQADKSINAWMEEVLSEAADDALGLEGDSTIYSAAIQYLIEDPRYSKRLIEAIAEHLQDNSFTAIFQFSYPLRKLLVGWDRIKPLLQQNGADSDKLLRSIDPSIDPYSGSYSGPDSSIVKLTDAILPYLTADPASAVQFNRALKKFLLGIAAVRPFIKEEQGLLAVVIAIESLIREIETGRSSS